MMGPLPKARKGRQTEADKTETPPRSRRPRLRRRHRTARRRSRGHAVPLRPIIQAGALGALIPVNLSLISSERGRVTVYPPESSSLIPERSCPAPGERDPGRLIVWDDNACLRRFAARSARVAAKWQPNSVLTGREASPGLSAYSASSVASRK
jgi:hypothetical protein